MEVTNLNKKNLVEASSFFLFEATGDSDTVLEDYYSVSDSLNDGDDDDAESCCWDSADQRPSSTTLDSTNDEASNSIDRERSNDDNNDEEGEEEEEEREEQDHVWDSRSEIGRSGMGQRKSSGSDDSTTNGFEVLNETEKNRLFWEACLSS